MILKVIECNLNKDLIKFENYEDVDLAKKKIQIVSFYNQEATKEYCKLKENEFFWFDLISCEIFENGLLLGKVKIFIDTL